MRAKQIFNLVVPIVCMFTTAVVLHVSRIKFLSVWKGINPEFNGGFISFHRPTNSLSSDFPQRLVFNLTHPYSLGTLLLFGLIIFFTLRAVVSKHGLISLLTILVCILCLLGTIVLLLMPVF
jgi:phosphoglycerol transferase MdoB-like AlkP superfamily enzyme